MTRDLQSRNILSPAHKRDPFPYYARLRAEAPAIQVALPALGKAWLITRYDDVVACLKNDRRFVKNAQAAGRSRTAIPRWFPPSLKALGQNMLDLDDPAHKRLRTLVNQAFSRRRMEAIRPRAQAIAQDLLDAMARAEPVDLVAAFAVPLPVIVICELLGVPVEDRAKFQAWSRIITGAPSNWRMLLALPPMLAFVRYLRRLFRLRRAEPRDDLVTALVQAEEAGDRLDQHELVAMVVLLLIAGHETTTNLIGTGTLATIDNAEATAAFRGNPQGLGTAVDELLRFCAPVETATERYAAEDMVLHGQTVRRGDLVLPVLASANRDDGRFVEPDRLDLGRVPNPHVAFGDGIHYCLGLHLAKMEAEIAFESLFSRYPRLALAAPSGSLTWRSTHVVRGLQSLPVRLN